MPHKIEIRPSALRELAALSKKDQRLVARRIDVLAGNPRPSGSKKLRGEKDLYRVRAGDYRIIYRIQSRTVTITVVRIRHRRDVYREM